MLSRSNRQVRVWEEDKVIPTYETGAPDKNPMFLEKRVYQGSSGRVYPYPVIDKIYDHKVDKTYRLVILENEYVRIEMMPELGGRIYRALDKTNQYDFVYYNRVIKPALVGLAGPWISGGIEFNWPQHHRPNTFGPVEYKLEENRDGSATVWMSEIDRMYGTKVTAGFTLYPGKAYLEINAQLYNRTPLAQTFLWWANPAVAVNDYTQSVFPPDVHAVFDHGKRDVSRFPIATGTYYKMDYSEGVDISRYKNIPVPTSYMAYRSDYDFVGGYDHRLQAGLLHVANHHVSPGKKQWTWGNGEFGQAWDRNLTDEDGPYIELMTGVFTDNQPDFSWLQPYEEKSFKQYFMPYKNIGVVKNATIDAAVNLEVDDDARQAEISVYATSIFEQATVELHGPKGIYVRESVTLSPRETFVARVVLAAGDEAHHLSAIVKDRSGRVLVSYRPKPAAVEKLPEAAKPLPIPAELITYEQLYLAGLHLEQYRHATFEPEDYYMEGLKRDPQDSRINLAYGKLLLRRGLFKESETYFRRSIQALTWRNPNPYDSEAYYQLGVALKLQGRSEEAFSALYKSVWSASMQDIGYFCLAQIAAERGDWGEALELIERSIIRNSRHYQALHLKTALLRKTGRWEAAEACALNTLRMDAADFAAHHELILIHQEQGDTLKAGAARNRARELMRGDLRNYLSLAADYAGCGLYKECLNMLEEMKAELSQPASPMLHYMLAFCCAKMNEHERVSLHLDDAFAASPDYCFPNSLFEQQLLEFALKLRPEDARAHYYLGNLLYDKKRHDEAIAHWEEAARLDPAFPTAMRNLALGYYNKKADPEKALTALEKAFDCSPADARICYERDQLYRKLGFKPQKRLELLEERMQHAEARDDLFIEYVTLLNTLGQHEIALAKLLNRQFHPWEGGEGKVTGQYVAACVELGKQLLQKKRYREAADMLQAALRYPDNLGEGKLTGAQENHVYYYLGCALEAMGDTEQARLSFEKGSVGLEEPASAMFYNDQPPDMIYYQGLCWLKRNIGKEAARRFNKLIDYGEQHVTDQVKIDYFAVSLPDFLVFEDNLTLRNEIHCRYMIGLGLLGKRQTGPGLDQLQAVLKLDPNHQGAALHMR
jgi:tetratricopeptide (TPR) repeat protein